MSEPSAKQWQPWQMGTLERRVSSRQRPLQRARIPEHETHERDAPRRRREDEISITLFNLAREEAEKKGFEHGKAEGYEHGLVAGRDQAHAEHAELLQARLADQVAPIEALVTTFRSAIDGLNEQVSHALVELALEAAQKLAGRALELKPEHILDDIEELMEEHPALTGSPTLYVNIDDLNLVQSQLSDTLAAAGWHIRPDVRLTRGDCRIETEDREIDATMADRWNRLLHAVGHDEH